MRIVIDMEGAQIESRFRGIGRYPMSFAQAIVRNRGEHEVILALSGLFPDTIEAIRVAFDGILSQENIRVWSSPVPERSCDTDNDWCSEVSEILREAFLASLRPDYVLVKVVGDGEVGEIAVSVAPIIPDVRTILIVDSLALPISADNLRQRAKLKCADHVFVRSSLNSEEVAKELGLSTKQIKVWEHVETENSTLFPDEDAKSLLAYIASNSNSNTIEAIQSVLPRLAYVSPLPPERSGIADYSALLLPFLAPYYKIDVVVDQLEVSSDWVLKNCNIITTAEFEKNGHVFERVLYHFGNNPMHAKMFELLEKNPGVAVLHDFFLSGVQWYREAHNLAENSLWNELYVSHGYKAIQARSQENDEPIVFRYPCNFSVIQKSLGVIVHSKNSLRLARQWYGQSRDFCVLPLLRQPVDNINRKLAREELGFAENDFIVCSFGFTGKTKLNHRLLDAWEYSAHLVGNARCRLVFVGDNEDSLYGRVLLERVNKYRKTGGVKITGWTDANTYRLYLAAADVAVQLRTLSRGETSAAVLDCLNYEIATVVNANGSMAELPEEVVLKIPDEFTDSELVDALEFLFKDTEGRTKLGQRAQRYLRSVHDPEKCAAGYAQALEEFYKASPCHPKYLVEHLAEVLPPAVNDQLLADLATAIGHNLPAKCSSKRLFLDVSVVARDDFKTGIQRVSRALILALIDSPPEGFRIEPVYLCEEGGHWHFRYAHEYTLKLLNVPCGWKWDEPIEIQTGDVLLGLDLAGSYVIRADKAGVYRDLMNRGVKVSFIVYDLIPVQFENIYPPGFKEGHEEWLQVVSKGNSAICISKSVAEQFSEWVSQNAPERKKSLDIRWFHLGADFNASAPTGGLPENACKILMQIKKSPSFLMVGTIEPRKGHRQVLKAFEALWADNKDLNLIIVGKEGWMVKELATDLRHHKELGSHLFWLEGISDEYLEKIYAASTCLIAASEGEGFGLPLIEAAQHKLPIIARDIPVFREVAGDHAFYFDGLAPEAVAQLLKEWLALYEVGKAPKSDEMPWLTWAESAQQLLKGLIDA
jgi:glycosyltransferase involved in cell wall biosynthesis